MVILKKIQDSWILSLLAPTNFGGLGNPRIWDWASRGSLGVWGKAGSGRLASFAGGAAWRASRFLANGVAQRRSQRDRTTQRSGVGTSRSEAMQSQRSEARTQRSVAAQRRRKGSVTKRTGAKKPLDLSA